MAAGDLFQVGPTSLDTGVRLSVQPAAGVEWVIHNVYTPSGITIDFEYFDGTDNIVFDSDVADGSRFVCDFCGNTRFVDSAEAGVCGSCQITRKGQFEGRLP